MSESHGVEPVVVRRRASLSAAIGAGAGSLAGMYLWRAADQGGLVSWLVGAVLGVIAVIHLLQWVDARTPLLVADETGVRVRFGNEWHGLLWSDVAEIDVQPRQGLRDGHLIVRADEAAGPSGVEGERAGGRSRRALAAVERRYGAPFAVPLALTTVISTEDVDSALRALRERGTSDRSATVAVSAPEPELAEPDTAEPDTAEPDTGAEPPEPEPAEQPRPSSQPQPEPALLTSPLRVVRRALRVDVIRRLPAADAPESSASPNSSAPMVGMLALAEPVEQQERPQGNMSLVLGAPAAAPPAGSRPQLVEAPVPPPAADPEVETRIGARLAEARRRVGLSVDELAARTRIRPHVIDGIEADDFAPCGGDFYARGHLRMLCRVVGEDPEPLLAEFEQRHATAPVGARRVFEAELATGTAGAIRGVGSGGPRWGALVATVLVLLLVWAVAAYVADSALRPEPTVPSLDQDSGGITAPTQDPPRQSQQPPVPPVERIATARISAVGGDSRVIAETSSSDTIFDEVLRDGQSHRLRADEPFALVVADAGAVRVRVDGEKYGTLGASGE
ncbi:MAG: helix-turn-helix domain-containing protein, partial [Actinomycetota bacterium]|nr:helix-turn-helix domain-containing protein [Actinomycetota bacterium]